MNILMVIKTFLGFRASGHGRGYKKSSYPSITGNYANDLHGVSNIPLPPTNRSANYNQTPTYPGHPTVDWSDVDRIVDSHINTWLQPETYETGETTNGYSEVRENTKRADKRNIHQIDAIQHKLQRLKEVVHANEKLGR